jgi:4-amino-4-deoxy-L-arabinose transferase-like glycosyltransferase
MMSRNAQPAENFLQSPRTVGLVSAIILCLFALTNLPWQLDDYDQAQQAFTPFEMIKEGHWFFQRTPHELVAQKPPLVGWASAATFAVTRSWDIAWRLPSFLAAVVLAIILFRSALAAYGAVSALVALAAFGLNMLSARLATLVRTDMPLALFTFLPGLLIWQKIRSRALWLQRDQWMMFALFTVSMFIKGPMNFAFLLPGIILFQWFAAKQSGTSAWCGWWPWIASLALILVWTICGIEFVPNFYRVVFMKEFLGRFSSTVHRSQPIFFYLPHVLYNFAPWSILMLALAVLSFRRASGGVRNFIRETPPETLWLVCWSFGGLVVMSLIPSKRVDRIYPIVPPLCLLLAAQVAALLSKGDPNARVLRWSAATLLFSIVSTAGYTALKIGSNYHNHADSLEIFSGKVNELAAAHHWRYEVIAGKGAGYEGMLLYLQKLHFIRPAQAVQVWNDGALDALVVPKDKIQALMPELRDATIAPSPAVERKTNPQIGYLLVTRGAH